MSHSDTNIRPWYLVRHAPVAGTKSGLYPSSDMAAELPPAHQIRAMAACLPDEAHWYVSPLARTLTTAEALRAEKSVQGDLEITEAIREQNFGDWQGLDADTLWKEIHSLPAHNWSWLAANTTPPNGESFSDVVNRVAGFIENIMAEETDRPVVLVTHAGIIRAFVGSVLGLNPDYSAALGLSPFSLTHLLHQKGRGLGGAWQLRCLNQRFDHLGS